MRLAVSNIAWLPAENARVIEVLRKHNIEAIEVAPKLLFQRPSQVAAEQAIAVRDFWKKMGISIVAMQALLFGHPELCIFRDEKSRALTLTYLGKIISIAGYLGAQALVFGSPKNRRTDGLAADEIKQISRGFFTKLGEIAIENNTTFCIEPNAVGYGCDFVTNTDQAVELVRDINHPGFRLHLDAGVMALNGESYEKALQKALPFMQHFHISEPNLQKLTGNLADHARLGRTLRRLGYDGWVSIEMRSGLGEDNVRVIDECLEFAKQNYLI